VRVERRFLEIHPETPAEGRPIFIVDNRWILEGAVPVEMRARQRKTCQTKTIPARARDGEPIPGRPGGNTSIN